MMTELRNLIEEAYVQCRQIVSGMQPSELEVRIVRNHIMIMQLENGDGGEDAVEAAETDLNEEEATGFPEDASLTDEAGSSAMGEESRERFHLLLKEKLSDITGYPVYSIQSDIPLDTGGKLDMIHFESDVESKFIWD